MDCIFCDIVAKKAPALIIYEGAQTVAFLDRRPQSRGHLQLVPKTHYRWIYDLPEAEIGQFFTTARKLSRGIIPVLQAETVRWATFGTEIKHAHLWLVPIYNRTITLKEGKGNFVHGQKELAKLLKDALNRGEVSNAS